MTALHCAALEGSVKIAKMLVDAGACLRCFHEEGMTPLHFAAMEGSLDVAQYLFEVGKDRNYRKEFTALCDFCTELQVDILCGVTFHHLPYS